MHREVARTTAQHASAQTGGYFQPCRSSPVVQQSQQCATPFALEPGSGEVFLKRFFDLSLDLLCVFDTDGALRRVNPAFTATLGWNAEDLTSRCFLDFVHPGDRDRAAAALTARATAGAEAPGEYRWRCANGSYRWLAWKSSSADEYGLMYGVARDVTVRRSAEAELLALHHYAAVGITMTSPTGQFIKANPAFCEMLGYSEAELRTKTSADITRPDDRPEQAEYLRRMITGETRSHIVEKQYLRKDGTTMWGRVTISAIRDSVGSLEAFVAVVEDVTEARRNEKALRDSEARFSRIAANVPGMMYQSRRAADGATSFTYVSDGASDIYGVSAAALQANPRLVFDVVHPDDRARFDAAMATSLDQRAPWRWDGRLVIDGVVKWVQGAARPHCFSDGVTVWDGLLLDVTEMKNAARLLEESETRYRSLFEYHPDAVYSLDTQGRFQSANSACEVVSGYLPGEMLGKPFEALVAPEQLPRAYALFNKALHGEASSCELTLSNKAGYRVEINVTNVPVIVSGEVVGVFGIARDLTRQRELESQLRHAQKMEAVGQLAAGVAHDFNNVLTVIQGCSEFLNASLPEGDERREDVDMIRDAASRASLLTRQLLAFSRKQVLQLSTIDLNACVTELERILGKMLGEDIALVMDLARDLDLTVADAGQLEQVIINMTVNARDAMPSGGELRFSTRNCMIEEDHVRKHPGSAAGPHVRLSITDNGCGMDETTLTRVFEPFFTTKGAGKGTGLGLATAYGIIRQSGGHVTVTSAPAAGTTFDIYLPVGEAAPETMGAAGNGKGSAASSATAAASPASQLDNVRTTETILLVEDDESVRTLAAQFLAEAGYGVVEAENGADALRMVRGCDGGVDLVVTDAMMPVMNGGELAEALASEFPDVKVLFMSLFTGDSIVQRGPDARRAFLPKPFSASDLTRKVQEVLGSRDPA